MTVLTAADVPGEGDTGAAPSRRAAVSPRGDVPPPAGRVGAGRHARGRATRRGARDASYEPLPAILTIERGDRRRKLSHRSPPPRARRRVGASTPARCASRRRARASAARSTSTSRRSPPSPGWTRPAASPCTPRRSIPPRRRTSSRASSGFQRHQVTVECLRMGGAFGGKEVQANAWAAIAALGAWKTRRPVRVRLTRELDMALTGKRHPYLARYSAGLRRRRPDRGAAARALLRRRLEPRPVGADHVAVAVPLRQRVPPARRGRHAGACAGRTRRRRRRSAASAVRRRCW